MERLASRKLWICILGMVLATWLRMRGLIDSADCVTSRIFLPVLASARPTTPSSSKAESDRFFPPNLLTVEP